MPDWKRIAKDLVDEDERTLAVEFLAVAAQRDPSLGFFNVVRVVGVEATLKLISAFGGTVLQVPSARDIVSSANLVTAILERLKGKSHAQLPPELQEVPQAQVEEVLGKLRKIRDERRTITRQVDQALDGLDALGAGR